MNDKKLSAIAKKCSYALRAAAVLSDIVIEKYFAGILPETRRISIKQLNKDTVYNYYKLRKYLGNNFYRVGIRTVKIIADKKLLSEKSKSICKRLVLKLVIPSQFDEQVFETRVEQYIIDTDYTAEERKFTDLMLNELLSVASIKKFPRRISEKDLYGFNSLNGNSFYDNAKNVYNGILQKKLRAGDNIMEYLSENLTDKEIAERLEKSIEFDYFFDKNGILKCDSDTRKDILIKNFLNTVLYSFSDPQSRTVLLEKLNSKYPVLISDAEQ